MRPLVAHLQVADPVLAAEIAEYAAQIANEFVAAGPLDPDTLGRIRALLGPVPRLRRDTSDPPELSVRQVMDSRTVNGSCGVTS